MSLLAQQEKYDAQAVEADIENLQREVADEEQIKQTLAQDSAQTLSNLKEWVAANKDRVRDQHTRYAVLTHQLKRDVDANVAAEAANAELEAYLNEETSLELARLLTEIRAMSDQYHQLLLDTGRAGRPPLF